MVPPGLAPVTVQEEALRLKRGGGLDPARPDWWPTTKRPQTTLGGLIAASVRKVPRRGGVPPCLAACLVLARPLLRPRLGTWVPRCLGVAHCALSPKAAQALGCSLTRVMFGRVTCMVRAASVSGLWTLGLLLLCGACVWVWALPLPRLSWLGTVACVLGLGFSPSFHQPWPGRCSVFVLVRVLP